MLGSLKITRDGKGRLTWREGEGEREREKKERARGKLRKTTKAQAITPLRISGGLLRKCPPAQTRQRTAGETNEECRDEEEWRTRVREIHCHASPRPT